MTDSQGSPKQTPWDARDRASSSSRAIQRRSDLDSNLSKPTEHNQSVAQKGYEASAGTATRSGSHSQGLDRWAEGEDWTSQEIKEFVVAACAALDVPFQEGAKNEYVLTLPLESRKLFGDAERITLTFDKAHFDASGSKPLEFVAPGGRTLEWLVKMLRQTGGFTWAHCDTAEVSRDVLASRLRTSYEAVGGKTQVTNLSVEERTLLWSSYRLTFEGREPRQRMMETLVDDLGRPLTAELLGLSIHGAPREGGLAAALKPLSEKTSNDARSIDWRSAIVHSDALAADALQRELVQLSQSLNALKEEEIDQLTRFFNQSRLEVSGKLDDETDRKKRAALREQLVLLEDNLKRRVESVNLRYSIQAKYEAATRLATRRAYFRATVQLTIGETSIAVNVEGWPEAFDSPPIECPTTGVSTHSLSASADGRLVATTELALCELSGGKYPKAEIKLCHTPRKRIHERWIRICPALGVTTAESYLQRCETCQQLVSPGAVFGKSCEGCRDAAVLDRFDPRLAELIATNPKLATWGRWKLREGAKTRFWTAGRWLEQCRVISHRETNDILSIQLRSTPLSTWTYYDGNATQQVL